MFSIISIMFLGIGIGYLLRNLKFQILIASDTDANLQHQRIKYVHRKIVHVKLEIIEDSDQTTYTEKCNNN